MTKTEVKKQNKGLTKRQEMILFAAALRMSGLQVKEEEAYFVLELARLFERVGEDLSLKNVSALQQRVINEVKEFKKPF